MTQLRYLLFLFIPVIIFLSSCSNDDEPISEHFSSVTEWMYGEMDYYYFWTDEMTKTPNYSLEPAEFYRSLLSPKDRFSFYSENYEELTNSLKGVTLESGFEYKLYLKEEGSDDVIMQISYVKKGSPADQLGLRRGDIIYAINDVQITRNNYRALLSDMNTNYSATYERYNPNTEAFDELTEVNIQPTTFAENPIYLDSVYEMEGKKIGYLVYNFFSPGPSANSTTYDDQMEAAFSSFKSQNIDEFILDLRYNSGGSETSARNLASFMVKNASDGDLMFKKKYNANVENEILSEDGGSEYLNVRFEGKSANIGQTIKSNTVYVITSARSASASEVVINSLKPYMDVQIVGETTVGKDAGSITIHEEDNPQNTWAIQPIIVKLVNAAGEDYPDGFAPNIELEEDFLVLEPLGSINEPLLNVTLTMASGSQPARKAPYELEAFQKELERTEIFSSREAKAYSGKFLLEE